MTSTKRIIGETPSEIKRGASQQASFRLLEHHQKLIDDSRISPEQVLLRGYRSVISQRELSEVGFAEYQCRTPGLLMPIRNIAGEVVTYSYRPDDPRTDRRKASKFIKYENPKGAVLPLDIPANIAEALRNPRIDLWITEGTRKVDSLVSHGACAVGVIGVWGWRGKAVTWEGIELHGRTVYLCFDSDITTKPEVKKALDELSIKLALEGAQCLVVQLPHLSNGAKCGVDDYFQLGHTLDDVRKLAPTPIRAIPDLRDQISILLDKRLKRSERQQLAQQIVADLDTHGTRYHDLDQTSTFYYFDTDSHRLITLNWSESANAFRVGPFANKLYRNYGLTSNDAAVLNDLQAAYAMDCPEVRPAKLFHNTGKTLYVQVGDTEAIKVTKDGIELVPNGSDGVLFREGIVEPLDIDLLAIPEQPERVWREVIDQLSLGEQIVLSDHEMRTLLEVYLHLSPWFWDWHGLELPILVCVGSSGSGKSHFWYVVQGVHLGLQQGMLSIRNTPRDIQELRTFLLHGVGMLVIDNFRTGSVRGWRDEFESTLSRSVTLKSLSYRPLRTDDERSAITPSILAITTTQVPMFSSDLVQRLIRVNFRQIEHKATEEQTEAQRVRGKNAWDQHVLLTDPGREALHHDMLSAARRFLQLASDKKHKPGERQRVRLSGLDHALLLMAEALGGEELRDEMDKIIEKLPEVISETQVSADPALVVLRRFANYWLEKHSTETNVPDFQLKEITSFVSFRLNEKPRYPFENSNQIQAYIREQPELVHDQTGVVFNRQYSATSRYRIDPEKLEAALSQFSAIHNV